MGADSIKSGEINLLPWILATSGGIELIDNNV